MNGRNSLLLSITILAVLALILRFRNPVLFKWTPEEDASLGSSGDGVHKNHIMGVATHDMLLSILLAVMLAALSRGPITFWLVVVLVVGEVMHAMFGVRSATFRWLFVKRP